MQENKTEEQEASLQDKVDVAWEFLDSMNPKEKVKEVTAKEKALIKKYVDNLRSKRRSEHSIKKAVLKKFKVALI